MRDLKGKRAFVTGATAGIGRDIALKFAQHGAHVHIFGTNAQRGQEVLAELEKCKVDPNQQFGLSLLPIENHVAVQEEFDKLFKQYGGIDILVNNAGITRDGLLMRMKEADWDCVMQVNLKSVFNTCRAAVATMMKQRSGHIINITSVIGLIGNAGQSNYAASKAGMIGFTQSLAQEAAPRGVSVNCIAPGFIETSMTGVLSPELKETILSKIPMKRMGQPQEIADAALFLAGTSYVTGQVLTVDGGMVM